MQGKNGINADESQAGSAVVEKIADKGLPKNHYLVLITDSVDKRKIGYKKFCFKGSCCQLPDSKGRPEGRQEAQDVIFREIASEILDPVNKSLDSQAFAAQGCNRR